MPPCPIGAGAAHEKKKTAIFGNQEEIDRPRKIGKPLGQMGQIGGPRGAIYNPPKAKVRFLGNPRFRCCCRMAKRRAGDAHGEAGRIAVR